LRQLLLEFYRGNCSNDLIVIQTIDSIFLHENRIAQPIQYSYRVTNEIATKEGNKEVNVKFIEEVNQKVENIGEVFSEYNSKPVEYAKSLL
jgi:hypothetical protein